MLRDQRAQAIHAPRIFSEAVDLNHPPEKVQGLSQS
jgi:hypothetical protein